MASSTIFTPQNARAREQRIEEIAYVHRLRTDGDDIKDFLKVGGDLLCRGLRIIEHTFASFRFFCRDFRINYTPLRTEKSNV